MSRKHERWPQGAVKQLVAPDAVLMMQCRDTTRDSLRWFCQRRGTSWAVFSMRAHTLPAPARVHPRASWSAMGTGGRVSRGAHPGGVLSPPPGILSRQRALHRDQLSFGGPVSSSPHAPHTPPLSPRRRGGAPAPGGYAVSPRACSSPVRSSGGTAPWLAALPMALTLARVVAVPALVAGAWTGTKVYHVSRTGLRLLAPPWLVMQCTAWTLRGRRACVSPCLLPPASQTGWTAIWHAR